MLQVLNTEADASKSLVYSQAPELLDIGPEVGDEREAPLHLRALLRAAHQLRLHLLARTHSY